MTAPALAVVVEHYWHPVPGGTSRAAHEILIELDRMERFRLTGVAAAHPQSPPDESPFVPVTHYRVPRPVLYEAWLRSDRFRLPFDADVIWAPALISPPRTAPLLVTVHDVDFLDHPDRLTRRGRSFFPRAWQQALERADRLVCSSHDTAAAVVRHGAPPDLVRTVPLGVSQQQATADEIEAARAEFGLPDEFVLWVGTVEPRKNLERLVEAMRPLELPLAVVGPEGWTVDERDLLAPLGRRALRLGTVSQTHLRALYAAATVFVLPSLAEGFGLPVLEAMVQGTAVITSSSTATEETAGGAAVLVDPTDASAIRDAIVRVVDDPELRHDLRARSIERAAACTWAESAAGYAGVFAELVG